jgi:hypothetical protein
MDADWRLGAWYEGFSVVSDSRRFSPLQFHVKTAQHIERVTCLSKTAFLGQHNGEGNGLDSLNHGSPCGWIRHATGAKADGTTDWNRSGAMYHVMGAATGERVVKDDDERRTFVGTLGEACERAGFRIHAWVLMIARTVASWGKCGEDGYRESEIKDHGIERTRSITAAGCKELQVSLEEEFRGQSQERLEKGAAGRTCAEPNHPAPWLDPANPEHGRSIQLLPAHSANTTHAARTAWVETNPQTDHRGLDLGQTSPRSFLQPEREIVTKQRRVSL